MILTTLLPRFTARKARARAKQNFESGVRLMLNWTGLDVSMPEIEVQLLK